MRNRRFCNLEFLFLFTFEKSTQCAKKVLRLAMEYRTVINIKKRSCLLSQKQWQNFLGKKSLNLALALVKNIRLKGQGIFSLEVNKPLGLQIVLGSESHVSRKEIRSLCNRSLTAVTYVTFLLTLQYTKNPELRSVRCADEFGLELNWK